MSLIFKDMEMVLVHMYDIIVIGAGESKEHLYIINEVLNILKNYGIQVNAHKCE